MDSREALVALNLIKGVGPVRVQQLLDHFGEATAILQASKSQLLQVRGIGDDTASAIAGWEKSVDLAGELKRISQPVATELEITELAAREMKSPGGGKALLFGQPTVNGVVSPFPVAISTLGSHKRMAMSMGANSVEEVANELGSLMRAKPPMREALKLLGQAFELRHAKPKIVKDGACKEVIHKFDVPVSSTTPWPAAPDVSLLGLGGRTLVGGRQTLLHGAGLFKGIRGKVGDNGRHSSAIASAAASRRWAAIRHGVMY